MAELSLGDRLCIPEDVVFQKVGEETVILNLKTAVYFGLDAIGARIWDLLERGCDLESVLSRLQEEYEVDPGELERDLLQLVGSLQHKGLVRIES